MRKLVDERQKESGAGITINITDIVAAHMTPPPGYQMKLVSQQDAQDIMRTFSEKVLQDRITNSLNLSKDQLDRFNQWKKPGNLGFITFEVTPTNVNTSIIARNLKTGEVLDLSE